MTENLKNGTGAKFYAKLAIILGIVSFVWFIFQFISTLSFQNNSIRTTGIIVNIVPHTFGCGRSCAQTLNIPVIKFKTIKGQEITYEEDSVTTHDSPSLVRINNTVDVSYSKIDPSIAHLYDPFNVKLWLYVFLDFALSFVLFIFGLLYLKISKQKIS